MNCINYTFLYTGSIRKGILNQKTLNTCMNLLSLRKKEIKTKKIITFKQCFSINRYLKHF